MALSADETVTRRSSSELADDDVHSSAMNALTSTLATLLSSSQNGQAGAGHVSRGGQDDDVIMMAPGKNLADRLHFAMFAFVGPIVCVFGLAGNVLSVVTWRRPGMRSSTGQYLIGQAVADFWVLVCFIFNEFLRAWDPAVDTSLVYGVYFSYIGYPVFFLAITCSLWFTVGVTVDRYIMVCWFAKAQRLSNERQANFGLMLIAVNSFIVNIPHFVSFSPVMDRAENETGPAFRETDFQKGSSGQFYEFWIHCIILTVVPWVTVFSLNIMIIWKLTRSNKKMAAKKTAAAAQKSKQSENQITRLLLTVTFTYLFFNGLHCVVQCFYMQRPPWANMNHVSTAYSCSKTGIVIYASTNFLLYCLSGRRFRQELATMLGCASMDTGQLSGHTDHSSSKCSTLTSTTTSTGY
ncbi:FMRFamide receptor [Aplysia californica]|uniref:FMRFamide receptor n=1 Tax=Aplysia californica TaxID=6500 RepID=A0ABM1A4A8_APLCA|nr:FMRFamide receptor [Aplysia californica]